eukprot:2148933-Pleurochrysis_carterae.AAC.8
MFGPQECCAVSEKPWVKPLIEAPGERTLRPRLPQIDAYPGSQFHACFGVRGSGLHGVSAAPKRKDAHDAGFLTGEQLEGRGVSVRRPACTVEDVDGMCDCVVPKRNGRAAGYQHRSCQFLDGANGTHSDSVELMYVGRAGCVVYSRLREKLREFAGEKFSGIITV